MKKCKACGLEKDHTLFTKDPRNSYGYGAKCKECFNARQRELYPNRPIKRPKGGDQYKYHKKYNKDWIRTCVGWASTCAHGCKARRDCSITKDDILSMWDDQKGICALTGLPMDYTASKRAYNRPSVDRIDNSKGYHKDNVRLVWHFPNQAKNEFSDEQLFDLCEQITKHRRRNEHNNNGTCRI